MIDFGQIYRHILSRRWFPRSGGDRRVLILDNNEDTLAMMQAALRDEGYRVRVTSHTHEFLALAERFRPGLIIMDIRLREGDSAGICRSLKNSVKTAGIPIILCSAYIVEGTDLSLYPYDAVIRKPFGLEELHQAVGAFF